MDALRRFHPVQKRVCVSSTMAAKNVTLHRHTPGRMASWGVHPGQVTTGTNTHQARWPQGESIQDRLLQGHTHTHIRQDGLIGRPSRTGCYRGTHIRQDDGLMERPSRTGCYRGTHTRQDGLMRSPSRTGYYKGTWHKGPIHTPVVYICLLFLIHSSYPAFHIDITHLLSRDGLFFQDDILGVPDDNTQLIPAASRQSNTHQSQPPALSVWLPWLPPICTHSLGHLAATPVGGPGSPRLCGKISTHICSLPCKCECESSHLCHFLLAAESHQMGQNWTGSPSKTESLGQA